MMSSSDQSQSADGPDDTLSTRESAENPQCSKPHINFHNASRPHTPPGTKPSTPQLHSKIDLQVAVLRNLPIPIIVLSPSRTVVFVNRAAETMLGDRDPIQSHDGLIRGRTLSDLGIRIMYNKPWGGILDKLAVAHERRREEQFDDVQEVDVVISEGRVGSEDRFVRVLLSTLTADDGMHYCLSFERHNYVEKKYIPRENPQSAYFDTPVVVPQDSGDVVKRAPTISRIKKAVFDSSSMVGFTIAADGNFYLTNKKLREVLGDVMGGPDGCDGAALREKLEIWDETFTRRLGPADFPGLKLITERIPFYDYSCGFTHAVTGEKIIFSVSGECLYDDDTGEFIGGMCWCKDLQEYSVFLAEKQASMLKSHETICNSMPHLVWTTTPDGDCDWFSDRWYSFTGMTPGQSLGQGYRQAIHPEDLPVLMNAWNVNRDIGKECECEVRYRRQDGVYKWMLARAVPYRDENGKILKWYGTNTDIHELVMKRIEAARNKLQMLTVLAHAEVNLFAMNKDRIITLAEGGMLWETQGDDIRNKTTLIGQDVMEVTRSTQPGGIPGYEKSVMDILSGKVGMTHSEDLIGDRVYRTRMVAELKHNSDDGGKKAEVIGVLGLSIDVTDMKAREQLMQDNSRLVIEEQAAKDSNRLKSQFLANMSHELRTPAAGIIGMVELLDDDSSLCDESREYVNSISLSAKALLTIVNDILDFSKIESGRLDIEEVPFNLSNTVGELCKLLRMFAQQKGLDFIYENSMDENLEVLGDPGRIRQVLSNLLTNALKFTTAGMVKISVSSNKTTGYVVGDESIAVTFIIEDTGIGIEKHVLDNLFRPFRQGDSSTARLFGGTGLGLTISKQLATLMHGSISLSSTPKIGSKATFTIPLKISRCDNPNTVHINPLPPTGGFRFSTSPHRSQGWVPPLTHRPLNANPQLLNQEISSSVTNCVPGLLNGGGSVDPEHQGERMLSREERRGVHVLVVEDNAINQTIALRTIRKLGFPCTAVWNGREALSYLMNPSEERPVPHVILMDVQMPVLDGYQATRILRGGGFGEYRGDEGVLDEEMGGRVGDGDGNENEKQDGDGDGNGNGTRQNHVLPEGHFQNRSTPIPLSTNQRNGLPKPIQTPSSAQQRMKLSEIPIIAMTASAIQGDQEKCRTAGMDDYMAKPVDRKMLEEMLVKWAGRRSMFGGAPESNI